MLTKDQVHEISRLLLSGEFSQRQIASRTGISRNTIATIAHRRHAKQLRPTSEDAELPKESLSRCEGCGAMTQLPCRACAARTYQQHARLRACA